MYNDTSRANLPPPRYHHLGQTKPMRVPLSVIDQCTLILTQFERIAGESGIERVSHIADKIIEGLEAVQE